MPEAARFLPVLKNYLRQIVPPVLATLIAALLIAGFNRAFSVHLVQPRMAALHSEAAMAEEAPRPATVRAQEVEAELVPAPVVEPMTPSERAFAKSGERAEREAGKDQSAMKTAALAVPPASAPVAAPAPMAPRIVARKPEPQVVEVRPAEPRVAAAPVVVGPMAQAVPQTPPPVVAANPMVTVPDRPRAAADPPIEQDMPQASQPRPLERFVDAIRPSSIFARMREFGDRIEAVGNDILPNVRP